MTITNPFKVVLGLLTALVALLPVVFIALWLATFIPMYTGSFHGFPESGMDLIFAVVFPLACVINVLIYALTAFYVTHAIKNAAASDLFRILGVLFVFFFPYLGMPAYFILYIMLPTPPPWAMKAQSPEPLPILAT